MKIYLYGMICVSNSFKISKFPNPDEYTEIEQSARFIGGETGTCATVLSSLGADVMIDGTHISRSMAELTCEFYKGKRIIYLSREISAHRSGGSGIFSVTFTAAARNTGTSRRREMSYGAILLR